MGVVLGTVVGEGRVEPDTLAAGLRDLNEAEEVMLTVWLVV